MKKCISRILAIVLTIALLASSFVLLGVTAEETAPATKVITVDGYQYEVYVDKTYSAYDSMVAAVNGLTPDSTDDTPENSDMDYLEGPQVTFANTAWKAEAKRLYGKDLVTPTYIKTHDDYTQIAFHQSAQGFGRYSVSLYNGGLHVNPSHSWLPAETTTYITLSYTVKEDGLVVLYDEKGVVSASKGSNTAPFWDWLSGNEGKDWISFSIFKNKEKLWPTKKQDNKFEKGGEQISFPDVGQLEVVAGDVISIKIEGYSSRAGIDINPVVAYALPDPFADIPAEETDLVVGENTYPINKNEVFDAYTALTDLTSTMTPGPVKTPDKADTEGIVEFNSKWAMSYQYVNNRGFGLDPWGGTLRYKYTKPYRAASGADPGLYGIQTYSYLSINTWGNCFFTSAVTFLPDSKSLYVSPSAQCLSTEKSLKAETIEPALKLTFSAYRDGELYLFDKTGKFNGDVNKDPYWANQDGSGELSLKILKNNTQIWPAEGESAVVSAANKTINFPDLGAIKVKKGDKISVVFYGNPEKPDARLGVICNPAVAYAVYVPPTHEELVVGDSTYNVLVDEQYNFYAGLRAQVEGKKLGKAVDSKDQKGIIRFKGNFAASYRFVSDKGFMKDAWGSTVNLKYCLPYYSNSNKTYNPGIEGLQAASYMAINSYNNCFFTASVLFLEEDKKLFISPTTAGAFTSEKIDKKTIAPTMKLTYRSNIEGKAVLFDTTGFFDGSKLNVDPYWANETDKATVKIEILKNGKKIWPVEGEQIISKNNQVIEFPDLGEIDLKVGDQIQFMFYGNPEAAGTRAAVVCNPGIAFTEVVNKVDNSNIPLTGANFGSEVLVLVSVITVLGAVVLTMGVVSKKRAHN